MVGLYEYDTATSRECIEDLKEIIGWLNDNFDNPFEYIDCEDLEKKGERLQYIAQRLRELKDE